MPGRIMEQEGAIGSQDLKKDRSHAQQAAPPVHPPAGGMGSAAHANGPINGANGKLSNGMPASASQHPATNGESSSAVAVSSTGNPPPLDISWRDGPLNKPLGTLITRMAAQCCFDLRDRLHTMVDLPTESHSQQPNGVVSHVGPDPSKSSVQKKEMLIEWANVQRERFIKTLVVADWSRNIDEKARLLDVKSWTDRQKAAHDTSLQAISNIKNNMINAKMQNPNIEGAMEVLATGKASWIPDLGYVPPKRLTAKQLLNTLRNMNVILATRINSQEDLPPHFTEYTIADGRATFTVQTEFEVDLAVADEDPATPFYFIDIRLAFTPAPELINDRLRGVMERKVNEELANNGLKGCYEFLHNFAITHKLNTLRSQALELLRGKWFDCIRVEHFRRRLIVQYWSDRPGPKSWIEIGISSGKRKGYQFTPPTPQLAVRWFRRGLEIKDEIMEFDRRNLDIGKALLMVMKKHTTWAMNDLKTRMEATARQDSKFEVNIAKAGSDSELDGLSLSMPSLRQALQIQVEPVTGQFAIMPPSQATWRAEHRLNNDPSADLAKLLAALPCAVIQEQVGKEAALIGWTAVQHNTQPNDLQKILNEPVLHLSVFKPSSAWGQSWGLAVTFSLAGEQWRAVSLTEQRDNEGKVTGRTIVSASDVAPPDPTDGPQPVRRETLLAVEKAAVASVGLAVTGKQLRGMKISHQIETLPSSELGGEDQGRLYTYNKALFVKFSALMNSQNKQNKPWADEVVRLTHHGIVHSSESSTDSTGSVRHDLRLSVQRGLNQLQKHVTRSKDRDLIMTESGALALKFLTPFGQPFVDQLQQRLRTVERLEGYLVALKQRHFRCTHVSLSRLDFSYSHAPEYSASISFDSDRTRLELSPQDSNPHQRVRVLLENLLNDPDGGYFNSFTLVIGLTLPALRCFNQLETKLPAKQAISIHPRDPSWFAVKYTSPLPSVEFQLKAKTATHGQKTVGKWILQDVKSTTGTALPDDLAKAVKELYQESGEHWQGMGNSIVVDVSGVAAALDRLDEVIRKFPASAEAPSASAVKEEETSKASAPESAAKSNTPAAGTSKQPPGKSQGSANGKAPGIKKEAEVVVLD